MKKDKFKQFLIKFKMIFIVAIVSLLTIILYYKVSNVVSAIIFGILAIYIVFSSKKKYGVFMNSEGIFGGVWFGIIGLACLQLHQFQVNWSVMTWFYLVMSYILFLLGYMLKRKNNISEKEKKKIPKKRFLLFLSLGVICVCAFLVVEIIIRKEIPLFSKNMSSYMNFGVTGLHYFTVCSCLIMPISIIYIHYYKNEFKVIDYIYVVVIDIISLLIPILIVSRQLLIITLVLTVAVISIVNKKLEGKILIMVVVLGSMGWMLISQYRNQDDKYLKQALQIQDDCILSTKQMQVYMYLTCNFDNFNLNVGKLDKYYYGQKCAFPIFAFTGLKFKIPSTTEDTLTRIVKNYNTYPLITEPYQDFGGIGICIYMLIIGIICGYIDSLDNKKVSNIIIKAIIKYCLAFSFFTNGFATPAIWFYIIAMIISNAVFFKNMELKKE